MDLDAGVDDDPFPWTVDVRAPFPRRYLSYPHEERCMILLGRIGGAWHHVVVQAFYPAHNVADDPVNDFAVRGRSFNEANIWAYCHGAGSAIGIVHSHLACHPPEPSKDDIEGLGPMPLGAVWHVTAQTLRWYAQDPRP